MTINEVRTGVRLLDWVLESFACSEGYDEAMDMLFDGLGEIRRTIAPDEWADFITTTCTNHKLQQILHEDPITHRSFHQPRGYAGDALLLDLIYQDPSIQGLINPHSERGKQIYSYMVQAPAARAVKLRRDLIAATIDQTVDAIADAEILSIACGHLRETRCSGAVQMGQVRRFVGLDHDAETISYNQQAVGALGIELVHANALHLLKSKVELGKFDLIYASGLFDYLNQGIARRLAAVMFKMLKPGGQMLVINAIPGMRDTGYMEAFMNWHLIYRDLDELADIAAEIPRDEIVEQDIFLEDNQNFAFLQLRKH